MLLCLLWARQSNLDWRRPRRAGSHSGGQDQLGELAAIREALGRIGRATGGISSCATRVTGRLPAARQAWCWCWCRADLRPQTSQLPAPTAIAILFAAQHALARALAAPVPVIVQRRRRTDSQLPDCSSICCKACRTPPTPTPVAWSKSVHYRTILSSPSSSHTLHPPQPLARWTILAAPFPTSRALPFLSCSHPGAQLTVCPRRRPGPPAPA